MEPKGVSSNGIDNAIAQISFPAKNDVTITQIEESQTKSKLLRVFSKV